MASLQLPYIKESIQRFLPDANIFLFGSRARGDASLTSDIDLLIVTDTDLSSKAKFDYEKRIRKQLTSDLSLPVDIILQTKREWLEKKNLLGHIVYFASKEAVQL